jgi:hypothetical protein
MNLSRRRDTVRPKAVRFVDVSAEPEAPGWLDAESEDPLFTGPEWAIAPLAPPDVPSHARPDLAPLLESVRPPSMPSAPSVFPSVRPPPPARASVLPEPMRPPTEPPPFPPRRSDTLIEDLVPRVEEEAAVAISEAIERFVAERRSALDAAEGQLVELVKVICRRVLMREVSLYPELILSLVREGLEALGAGDRVTVRLGPFFADARESIAETLRHKGIECSVVIDPDVGDQGCLLETELGRVDESVETRLELLLRGPGALE